MKTQNLLEELKKAGVRAREYARPPFGESIFALGLQSDHPKGTIRLYQGNARIEAHPDRKLRQCAVTVREGNRIIKRHVKTYMHSDSATPPLPEEIERRLKTAFPVLMPKETEWTVRNVKFKKTRVRDYSDTRYKFDFEGNVTASVRNRTVNHFLIGMDESRNFICPLPEKPESVVHARRMLMPDEAKGVKGVKRQGEWFFIPVSKEVANRLPIHKAMVLRLGKTLHTAKKAFMIGHDIYAHGYVIDQRVGHHKPTFLKGWHKVVKNKEATLHVSAVQREAARTRTRRWD